MSTTSKIKKSGSRTTARLVSGKKSKRVMLTENSEAVKILTQGFESGQYQVRKLQDMYGTQIFYSKSTNW